MSSIDAKTGSFTTGNGLNSTGGNVIEMTAARRTLPTTTVLLSGTNSTYTTPANALWLEIEMVGGGAGGAGGLGAGGAAGATCWNTSGTACTTPVYSAGGANATTGGSVTGTGTCFMAVTGATGGGGNSTTASTSSSGGQGGGSILGGAGPGVNGSTGGNAITNSGSGGGGGGASGVTTNSASGGGAGAGCRAIVTSPAGTYVYTIGLGSSGGGPNGTINGGGTGAAGRITVIEHYGT